MQCTLEGPGWPSGSKSHSSKAHGLWAPAQVLQPKQEPRSSDAPLTGSVLPGLFQSWLLQSREHSRLAVSLQVPSAGSWSLHPSAALECRRSLCLAVVVFVLSSLCK